MLELEIIISTHENIYSLKIGNYIKELGLLVKIVF